MAERPRGSAITRGRSKDSQTSSLPATPMASHHGPRLPHRIAIIGSGAAGSSATYFLHQAFSSPTSSTSPRPEPLQVAITVYERNTVIGGRVNEITIHLPNKTVAATKKNTNTKHDTTRVLVETGASIFLKTNRNLYETAKKFNLEFTDDDSNEKDTSLGVYDGHGFIFTTTGSTIWDTINSLWRYGLSSPITVYRAAREAARRFYRTYDDQKAWDRWGQWLDDHNFGEYMPVSIRAYLKSKGVSDRFIDEVVEPITRVNYGQNANINSLAGLVVLTALFGDVKRVKAGNARIFSKMLEEASPIAKVKLNTQVDKIFRLAPGAIDGYTVESTRKTEDGRRVKERAVFDTVLIACPIHQSGIDFPNVSLPKQVPYVELHVTFVIGQLNPSSFGFPSGKKTRLPTSILTIDNPAIPFLSLGLIATSGDKKTTITKLFSRKYLSDDDLSKYYSAIKHVIRKVWKSYPELTTDVVDRGMIELANNLFYVNGLESAFSTMESETVAAANVVRIIKARVMSVATKAKL
ncbi:hypothetical protein SeMB42_g02495 [Synchytrium endobioticum]|uniref:Prenylcysteine lyase domain-containing protein n=1 Tax=Synchytrium endobioticum TaxID=286115 RepID=A0A507D3I0_9FUNG|nr:hypothetical protein SeLEV6574_g03599 [Synchytrium endobioticum]TPX49774.1 hypothetical protein SeMB42_g02495 [Synchytrium endobioticum]